MIRNIDREEVKRLLGKVEKARIVEALPEKYYEQAHIPGALQIDYKEVAEKAPSLLSDKAQKIVVYCASSECANSEKAARTLEYLGYSNVFVYRAGKKDWIDSGYPVESSS